ncbi:O-methyltransferase [Microbacterium testaceum]|uniref:O-methyltransferase n=1 Tax=Microbacterium testaceum TaxID=2033 RepID=UPI0024360168|nr:O-methyltransferase [Microbacterium testaceum]
MNVVALTDHPARSAQARMVVDACRRLTAIAPLTSYQFVGSGGLAFQDFRDVHSSLGITAMTSISVDEHAAERLEFNKPFEGMKILTGAVRDQLPLIDWKMPVIVWLEYAHPLTRDVLRDFEYIISNAQVGSFVAIGVEAEVDGSFEDRIRLVRENLGDLAPSGLDVSAVTGSGVARIQQKVLADQGSTHGRAAHGDALRQILDIEYQTAKKRTTWGGVVSSVNFARMIELCRFDDLTFSRQRGERPLKLRVPKLTAREWDHLERTHGEEIAERPRPGGIGLDDLRAFREVYRYLSR